MTEEEKIGADLDAADDAASEFYNRPQTAKARNAPLTGQLEIRADEALPGQAIAAGYYPTRATALRVEAETEDVVFDQTAPQCVTLVDENGLNTIYHFEGYDDDNWVEFDKLQAFSFDLEDGDGIPLSAPDFAASGWYFDEFCETAEGFEELPDNWKSLIVADEKAEVVNHLFAVKVLPPAKNVTPGIKRRFAGGNATYTLRVPLHLAGGARGYVDLEHTLKPRSDAGLRKFVNISGRAVLKEDRQVIKQDARALGRLYDEEMVSADDGYTNGIPLFHKVAVIRAHYAAKVRAVRGK